MIRANEFEAGARARRRRLLTTVCAMALLCAACVPTGSNYTVQRLASGRDVKVLGVTLMHYSNDSTSLILSYETDLPLSDKAALNAEVDDIWHAFEPQANSANVVNASIIAKKITTSGFFTASDQSAYAFSRNTATGTWSEQNGQQASRDNRGLTGLDSVSAHRP